MSAMSERAAEIAEVFARESDESLLARLPSCDCFDPECGYPHGRNRIGKLAEMRRALDAMPPDEPDPPCPKCGSNDRPCACDIHEYQQGQFECDDCDGCGWVEGGATLKSGCRTCNGTGVV